MDDIILKKKSYLDDIRERRERYAALTASSNSVIIKPSIAPELKKRSDMLKQILDDTK
ncbi:hypothetical protein [Jeotgalibacillus campisalis]|uniref:Uncharacterized protein n=1 Tax=Jeotgalibacillus campisalis TaxID=220754 RepID=A0A0C2RKZ8_9BACL|nr:hypothetical protein [Jeotgalibacillus campisalis]KIL50915.1 hypothetical protein KR50_07960 [Jeotgalibacillus campisalis]